MSLHESQIATLETDIFEIKARIQENDRNLSGQSQSTERGNRRLPNETQREFLIRTGKITPFSRFAHESATRTEINLSDALYNAEAAPSEHGNQEVTILEEGPRSHQILLQPGFADEDQTTRSSTPDAGSPHPTKRRRLEKNRRPKTTRNKRQNVEESTSDETTFSPRAGDGEEITRETSDNESSSDGADFMLKSVIPKGRHRRDQSANGGSLGKESFAGLDDGNEKVYQARLESWVQRRRAARHKVHARNQLDSAQPSDSFDQENEIHLPHPTVDDTDLGEGYRMPGDIYPSLFDYQKTGVQWLWELYSQQVGGIVGDEMGLGKTIQVISFLAGLHYSRKVTKPIIVVAPATVMKQWVNEFHTWWPPFRVSILHSSGSGMIDIGRESQREEELLSRRALPNQSGFPRKGQKAAEQIVDRVLNDGHVLVTTYSGLQTYAELLVPVVWEYAVLDEGHKIRNPNAGTPNIIWICSNLLTRHQGLPSSAKSCGHLTGSYYQEHQCRTIS